MLFMHCGMCFSDKSSLYNGKNIERTSQNTPHLICFEMPAFQNK